MFNLDCCVGFILLSRLLPLAQVQGAEAARGGGVSQQPSPLPAGWGAGGVGGGPSQQLSPMLLGFTPSVAGGQAEGAVWKAEAEAEEYGPSEGLLRKRKRWWMARAEALGLPPCSTLPIPLATNAAASCHSPFPIPLIMNGTNPGSAQVFTAPGGVVWGSSVVGAVASLQSPRAPFLDILSARCAFFSSTPFLYIQVVAAWMSC